MTRDEFMEKYGSCLVKFTSYFKYTFTFTGETIEFHRFVCEVGGYSGDIYAMEVTNVPIQLMSLEPSYAVVYDANHQIIEQFTAD